MIFVWLLLLVLSSFLLIKATDILVINLKSLSERTRLGKFAVTGLVLSLATSLPEFFVGITSALSGTPILSLGNIVGSNIANLSLIIGGAAVIGGAVQVRGSFLKEGVFYSFLAGAAPMVLLFDKSLSRFDAVILLCLYVFYQLMIFKQRKAGGEVAEDGFIHRLLRRLNHRATRRDLAWIFLGAALLLFSAEMIIRLSQLIAVALNLPILLIGLILVAVGTSLPELAFETRAIKSHQPSLVFGDLLGSIVANATLILGLTALISPFKIQAFPQYLLATMAFVVVFAVFYFFIRTKRRLDRWEGVVLVGLYLAFVLSEFLRL